MENKIYDSEIEACLDSFCAEKGISDISKESRERLERTEEIVNIVKDN